MNSPRSWSLASRSGVIRGQRSRLAHLVPGGQVGLHTVDDPVQLASLLRHLLLQLAELADGGPQLVVIEIRELGERGVGDEALAAPPPLDVHRRSQTAGQTTLLGRSARPLVGEDLRERGDEVPEGAARRTPIQLRLEDVDARLGHATDVRHLGLDLEALGLPAAQLFERPLGKMNEELRIEHLVDAAPGTGQTIPSMTGASRPRPSAAAFAWRSRSVRSASATLVSRSCFSSARRARHEVKSRCCSSSWSRCAASSAFTAARSATAALSASLARSSSADDRIPSLGLWALKIAARSLPWVL